MSKSANVNQISVYKYVRTMSKFFTIIKSCLFSMLSIGHNYSTKYTLSCSLDAHEVMILYHI